jgi:hypothetical protein
VVVYAHRPWCNLSPPAECVCSDERWAPRRLVSAVAMPGNDFYLFDDLLAGFLLYAGSGTR